MRFVLLFVILVLGAALFVYPPLLEETDGECSALELRVTDLASHDSSGRLSVGALYGSSSSHPSGGAYARDHYPLLPPAIGCTIAYWRTVFDPRFLTPAPARRPALASEPRPTSSSAVQPLAEPEHADAPSGPIIARRMTLNGDPISPATMFTLPMNAVAIRVDNAAGRLAPVRFQLIQGSAVLSSCTAQNSAPATAWCQFNISLRKGVYSIAFSTNNVPLGQSSFTVVGN